MLASRANALMHKRCGQMAPCSLSASAQRPIRSRVTGSVVVRAAADSGPNPVRSAIGGLVSGIYKLGAMTSTPEAGLSPLWTAISKLDKSAVQAAVQSGADVNERNTAGDTPLLMIARQGHYKYPPAEIPAALVAAGADKEAKDKAGLTALQVSMLSGWQNIAELLIKSGADTSGVASIKNRLTCPDCKALVVKYSL